MKIQKINIRQLSSMFPRERTHFIASLTCGIAMGVLFSTRIATYQAHYFQGRHAEVRTSASATEATSSALMTSAPIVPQHETDEELTFFVSPQQFPLQEVPHSNEVRTVKRGKQVITVVLPPASSAQAVAPILKPHAAPVVAELVPKEPEPQTPTPEASSSVQQSTDNTFPPFIRASQPVSRVPNWGAMSTPAEWRRSYSQLTDADFVPIPAYDLQTLTIPLKSLSSGDTVHPADVPTVTAKLYYSTRYMAKYDLDADEHSGNHPGVDLKLALGTPIGAVGGGRVYAVSSDARLGLHVIVEHRNESGQFFSVYAHLGSSKVSVGDTVKPGQTLGFVGLTGMTTMAHLHLEVHRGAAPAPEGLHAAAFAGSDVINPMTFIRRNGKM